MLEEIIVTVVPIIISVIDLFGIIVVTFAAIRAFWHYLRNITVKNTQYNVKYELATGMATGLEFKMAAEILKTVIIHTPDELIMLGAIILLRALLSFIIHLEMKRGGVD